MSTTTRTICFAATVLSFGLLATPGQAKTPFHIALIKSEPAKDSTVTAPKAIKLWFDEKPVLKASRITLTGPGGVVVKLGPIALAIAAKSPLVAPIMDVLRAGTYKVTWSTAAPDGHAENGSFSFTVKATATPTPAATPSRGTTGQGSGSGSGGGL